MSLLIDKTDKLILKELQKNAKISNLELSKRIYLSPSPCLDRVKRLEKNGFIDGYTSILNPEKLGYDMLAYVTVTLDKSTNNAFKQFQEAILDVKEVIECDMVAGGFDYLLKLCVKNMKHYRTLLGVIAELPGVSQTHTYIVIEKVKKNKGVWIE